MKMAGFDLFTSIKTIPGVEFVTFAILAGCNNPAQVSEYMHTLPEYPYVDTDVVLESITDKVRELTGYALIGTLESDRQIAIDTLKGELGEWK
jgi:hypothetical protein